MSADGSRNLVAKRFGVNLRNCRQGAGVTQENLGFRAGIHRTEVGLLERGKREPRLGTVIKLAFTLSVPPTDLIKGISWSPDRTEHGGFECGSEGTFSRP